MFMFYVICPMPNDLIGPQKLPQGQILGSPYDWAQNSNISKFKLNQLNQLKVMTNY